MTFGEKYLLCRIVIPLQYRFQPLEGKRFVTAQIENGLNGLNESNKEF